jgi:HSP20 family protein
MAEEKKTEGAVARRHPFGELGFGRRWEPFRSLLDEMFTDWPRETAPAGIAVPSVDITESDGEYRVHAELPGVEKDDVTVEVEQGVLCIRGEKKSRRDEKNERGRRLECSYGAFSRSFTLPQDADPERISAEFKNGVLDVKIAKQPESKPKQIAVKS